MVAVPSLAETGARGRLEQFDRDNSHRGPAYLARWLSNGRYKVWPHIKLINDVWMRAAEEGGHRIILSIQPRIGKSECISKWGPVAYLRKFPDRYYAVASYGQDLAQGFGRKARNEIQAHGDAIGVKLSKDSTAADTWHTEEGGGFIGVGVGGAFTGRGAHMLVIDDPVKDAKEAFSPTVKQNVWDWWLSVASTRLEPGASVIVVMTRWSDDDLAGRLLEEGRKNNRPWTEIRIPSFCDDPENDPLGRELDEPIPCERVDVEDLRARRDRGDWEYHALYDQRPLTSVGGSPLTMDDLPTWPQPPNINEATIVQSWDPNFEDLDAELAAKGKKQKKSRFGGIVAAKWRGKLYVLDHHAEHAGFVAQEETMLTMREKWARTSKTYLEFKANGAALASRLKAAGIPGILPVRPAQSKLLRLTGVSHYFKAHDIYFPPEDSAPWVAGFKARLCNWPKVDYDDDMDALVQLVDGELSPDAPTEADAEAEQSKEALRSLWASYNKDP